MPCSQLCHLKQHSETDKHKANVERRNQGMGRQQFLQNSFQNVKIDDPFTEDLCDALISSNIPFNKINNQSFKYFLEKYCDRKIPDESTLRKNYLQICFKKV